MRTLLFLALFCATTWATYAQTEDATDKSGSGKTVFGIKAGVNSSALSTSINSETSAKFGLNLGVFLKTPISSTAYFRPELYYSSQGVEINYLYSPNGPSVGRTTTTLNYINIPILVEFGKKVSFQVGPQFGFLLNSSEKGTIQSTPVDDDLSDVMSGIDVGVVAGIGVELTKQFSLGLRYNLGLTDVYTGDDKNPSGKYPTIANRVLHFYVAVQF